ncbi:MAG: non-hydrolyzing UDP-N-acetylglucosamine 2-epimerase [Brevefilum fermentans]|nr:UDP-N-acetylglucosamine 2-epimerase (non-hydrolyzing) [Brevefilum fermentans]MDI9566172.1 UDP-N-acetylglucosamine 2-epimerase (non-hydrolyzing) [Chloroflexota bacterium]HOM66655.1 UDP-N-acetylglucosamine 2-epimerase (non-hydrolyzing) [Brevefilum fermentans]HPX96177.1 UDP-N-acetylglucosamine 2-epimerase (non-hydrolyzing) [Brevefilum fermentans]
MEQKLKVMTIFGTRPEAVKMAPVIKALREHPDHIDITVCVTAQHREMLDQVLQAFDIIPDIDLDLMDHDQTLPELTARIFTHLDPVLLQIRPDWLLVQGDTTTVMAAAILGYYRQIRVGHIEAGLRTHDKWQPFPEEMNRRIAGVVADLHFAPTENNRQNLLREGIPDEIIKITGNPVIDALKIISQQPAPPQVDQLLDQTGVSAGKRRLVLVTAHRRENFGQPILDICLALKRLAQAYQDEIVIVYPVHLNPNIHVPVHQALSGIDNIHLLPPLDYLPLVHLMKHATLILTDSGGIQEEAPSFGVPTLVLRQRTERQEGVQAGTLKLVGTDPDTIFMEALKLLDDRAAHAAMSGAVNPYGDGHAAERIVAALLASQTG